MNTKGRKEQIVRLGRGLEYKLIIQRGKGRNAEFIAGVHFAGKPTRRELRKWRDAIQRGIEPNSLLAKPATKSSHGKASSEAVRPAVAGTHQPLVGSLDSGEA
ncbi:MAG TPA: hypothetical protein PKW18_13105 [Candidatus Sumerlaeota bacterium]|nr:hypothetical protein [Candidatus Sumerlaeota bacterium]